MKDEIVLIGAGAYAHVIVDLLSEIEQFKIAGVCTPDLKYGDIFDKGIYCLGDDTDLLSMYRLKITNAVVCVGSLTNLSRRMEIYVHLKSIGFNLPILVHPSAVISKRASLSEGTCVMPRAVVNAYAQVGVMGIINTSCVIEHHCLLGDNVHVSPTACLCGGVSIGGNTHIGAGSVINQGISVGNDVIIGSGSVVTRNVIDNKIVKGVPAK
ncbi:MAG: hypothetical protein ATN34_04220 [Epulopiscium sp. Nele67-Bin002]|nr:MAG: hypothetical protein BEN18_03515 [Epulopiscium sp. Nuni2H_MBin001]OON92547.1 MAG: hypothetical protein ATN34_04220 [Epulopiscium sp. Nele67-Bin002]OON92664.1 MAG: hypothetical protein ATN33_06870 [Epulopiscium sp. Nele67-Bin001]